MGASGTVWCTVLTHFNVSVAVYWQTRRYKVFRTIRRCSGGIWWVEVSILPRGASEGKSVSNNVMFTDMTPQYHYFFTYYL